MYTIDDPLFALILRFIGRKQGVAFSNEEFLRKELEMVENYINTFPAAVQEERALEWVEMHAREYRSAWEKEIVDKTLVDQKCADCPLIQKRHSEACLVHDQWRTLLVKYVGGEMNASSYVRKALEILSRHKQLLKSRRRGIEVAPG